jgi:hypothetical protein
MLRSRAECVDDILVQLGRLRLPERAQRLTASDVEATLDLLADLNRRGLLVFPDRKQMQADGRLAQAILEKTRRLYKQPPDRPSKYDNPDVRLRSLCKDARGPRADFDLLTSTSALLAAILVEDAGARPTATLNGVTHSIAQIIREDLTRRESATSLAATDCLAAVRSAVRERRSIERLNRSMRRRRRSD